MTSSDMALSMRDNTIDIAEKRSATVLRLPESGVNGVRDFLREVEQCMSNGRPYLVLDCSAVSQLDKWTAGLLLHCLEEAMKRNGDVKLSGISLMKQPLPGFSGANRLFEVFDTVEDATGSFHPVAFEAADASESAA